MPNRINYQLEMEKVLRTLDGTRPKLLLHACCAPCSSATLERLAAQFLGRVWYNSFGNRCRISSLVEWSLPKPQRRVRFPYPAPQKALA